MNLSPVSGSTVAASLPRRHLMVAGALAAFVPAARSASSTLPQAVSLADELAAALRHGEPLVVMASANCSPAFMNETWPWDSTPSKRNNEGAKPRGAIVSGPNKP